MDRWTILDQLNDNWRGKFPRETLALFEKRTRRFSKEALQRAVGEVIDKEEYPPRVSHIVRAAAVHEARLGSTSQEPSQAKLQPGDTDPLTGDRYMTGEEAKAAYLAIMDDEPKLFDINQEQLEHEARLKLLVTRLCARAYLRCMGREGVPLGLANGAQGSLL